MQRDAEITHDLPGGVAGVRVELALEDGGGQVHQRHLGPSRAQAARELQAQQPPPTTVTCARRLTTASRSRQSSSVRSERTPPPGVSAGPGKAGSAPVASTTVS
ncbi:hypothetical protein GCM10025872_30410 [Barrientosiimonas endolithica]|uniref:Uncharacterized protein n=1 Tax=Barrientosiimonas endolithica TaxID=1535208 RepID=A0ABN6YPM8_9MICO|nr:hypothetical protein GCM10025872_30410 [Barrientosiimonas endolithica]